MKFAVVTCTVDRPELFALCEQWVQRQTLTPDARIVVTDRRPPFPNLAHALSLVPPEHHVVVMEDDDWYSPDHCSNLLSELEGGARLSAPHWTRRCNVPAMRVNRKHSPTPGPGMVSIHKDYVSRYAELVNQSDSGDRVAWIESNLKPHRPSTVVGIKGIGFGLPGLKGKTIKHHPASEIVRRWEPDPDYRVFRSWVGDEDAHAYLRLLDTRVA